MERVQSSYSTLTQEDDGGVTVTLEDGRINVNIDKKSNRFHTVVEPLLKSLTKEAESGVSPPSPTSSSATSPPNVPPLNIAIHIVGSRGDVQPFVALGLALKQYGHRVRIATHPTFQSFVEENGLEFFNIGGDPKELMQFMVNNPNLIPSMEAIVSGEVARRQKGMAETIQGCWRSCFESGNGMEPVPNPKRGDIPFVADAIIANPPSYAHIHCAEKLGIPLHVMFTMPWSPTQSFPHPLANIQSSNADPRLTNLLSYIVVDLLTWQGLGPLTNKFRKRSLGLEPVDPIYAIGMLWRQKIPHSYCWSPALIPKPVDWANHNKITGFNFLSQASTYDPPADLKAFLARSPSPIYIGFGSIVVDDPTELTAIIFNAIRATGVRAIVSKGWGGLGSLDIPEGVLMLENCPHDWLFPQVSAVIHHGGAGTVSAGIAAGKPTAVVPFFGDQPFWGEMIARAGAGPRPIPRKQLTVDSLAEAILFTQKPEIQENARALADKIKNENGPQTGLENFHSALPIDKMKCSLVPERFAVWKLKGSKLLLSPLTAAILLKEKKIDRSNLRLHRCADYNLHHGCYDIVSGSTTTTLGWMTELVKGVSDISMGMVPSRQTLSASRESLRLRRGSSGSATSRSSHTDSTLAPKISGDTAVPPYQDTAVSDDSRSVSQYTDSDASTKINRVDSMSTVSDSLDGINSSTAVSKCSASECGDDSHKKTNNPPITPKKQNRALKGAIRIASSTARLPGEMLNTTAQGLHNMPKLYGDKTVRTQDRITGYQSGLAAGGKEIVLGLWDGITGLATQPVKGYMEDGPVGIAKGAGKGILSSLIKPFAGTACFFAFPLKGIERQIDRGGQKSTYESIFTSRIEQGEYEMERCSELERKMVLERWYYSQEAGVKFKVKKDMKKKATASN